MSLSIRARLTLWYTATLSLVLAGAALALYASYARARLERMDDELARAGALVAGMLPPELDEGVALSDAARGALEDIELPGRWLAVFDADGRLLAGRWDALPNSPGTGVTTADGRFRVRVTRHQHGGATYLVGTAESLAPVERELALLRDALLASVALALLLAAVGGWWIARAALQPLASLAGQVRGFTGASPGARLTTPDPHDELGQLARAFNALLARLEGLLARQRQFMADASHELRTPVSIARTAIDVTLARAGRDESEYVDALSVLGEQVRRLTRIVEDMFTLTRADAAGLPLERRPLYLDEVVAASAREARLLAAPRDVRVEWRGPAEVEIEGDERLLRRLLLNLLDNAVRHAPPGGRVRVELDGGDAAVRVAVTNDGDAIPPEEHERIFERFVRLESGRRPGDGAGLGLPIARAIAEAHAGRLALVRSDASGTTFALELPRRAPGDEA